MIRPQEDAPPPGGGGATPAPPWEDGREVGRLALATLWTSGPDPGRDGLFRVQARRRDRESGAWSSLETFADPWREGGQDAEASARATRRMFREFGVRGEDLRGAPAPAAALAELAAFVGDRPLVVPEASLFLGYWSALLPGTPPPAVLDLDEVAALVRPGRPPGSVGRPAAREAFGPGELAAELAGTIGAALDRGEASLALLAHGLASVWQALRDERAADAARLALVLRLCEYPSRWSRGAEELFPEHAALTDGRLSDAVRAFDGPADAVEAAVPPWARAAREERQLDPLPPNDAEAGTLDTGDLRRVAEIFQEHLPRLLDERGGAGAGAFRPGQHAVAGEVARSLGRGELFLVHAPTGTGKTLAYLVPALIWALRNGIRVGVATFTRALQEQAMGRDVPLALELLRRADLTGEPRVAQLKGRRNYLCWRALRLEAPPPIGVADADETLAWTALALFALGDPEGDLDRLPARPPLRGTDEDGRRRWRTALERLVRRVRADSGCCTARSDREACGADAARRRAERAHLVVTNHAFALARREFFRHIVFDECEHLHDVAHDAFSHTLTLRSLRERLHALLPGPGERGGRRTPLARVRAAAVPGSEAHSAAEEARAAHGDALETLDVLAGEVAYFKRWREATAGRREAADHHSLFREFADSEEAEDLLAAHRRLTRALDALRGALARLSEELDTLPVRGGARLRRALDIVRADLEEAWEACEAWIPRGEGGHPAFRRETFYDLETTSRGEDLLAARVLLPHEFLGRRYYPDLAGAVLLSATTWLRGGFDAAAGYLGLTRAADPTPEEDREPCVVRTFRAPEAFDYGRVLVGVPRDGPSIRHGKDAYLDHVARFLGHLAERTHGRLLALFTNLEDVQRTGRRLAPFFRERCLPLWYQGMEGVAKEELGELFRGRVDATLLGVDTFWYGADFPGPTLEHLVIVRLPYGVPDRYHHAQCAALGPGAQRNQIYMPRALAKFRQGFGRLMRKETDKGCVYVLDARVLDPRHRAFLHELPVRGPWDEDAGDGRARLVVGDAGRVLHEAFAHVELGSELARRGLDVPFAGWTLEGGAVRERPVRPEASTETSTEASEAPPRPRVVAPPEIPTVTEEDIPF